MRPHRRQPVAVLQLPGRRPAGRSSSVRRRGRAPSPRRRRGSASPRVRGPAPPASSRAPRSAPSRCPRPARPRRAPRRWPPAAGTDRPARPAGSPRSARCPRGAGRGPSGCGPAGRAGRASRRRRAGTPAARRSAASAPADRLISPDSGSRACSHRVNRMASSLSETSYRSRPAVLRWPSVNTTYSTWATETTRSGSSPPESVANGASSRRSRRLGPADPLGHGGFGDEERPRDLGGGQAADGAQGEGDLAGPGQVGMTAQQQQRDRVVDDSGPVDLVGAGGAAGRPGSAAGRVARARSGPARTAPGRPAGGRPRWSARRPGGRGRPASATAGTPPAGPPAARPRRRRSRRTGAPGPRGPAARGPATGPRGAGPSSSERLTGRRRRAHIAGRSSTVPPGWAKWAAISSARSRVAQSIRKKPASCSLVSAYGPSVTRWPSGLQPNTVDDAGSASASAVTNSPDAEISSIRASKPRSISACCSDEQGPALLGELLGGVAPGLGVAVDQDHVLHG